MRYRLLPTLLPLLALAGCGVATPHPSASASALSVDGNWQIASNSLTSPLGSGLLLYGELQGSGANISGTLSFSDLSQTSACVVLNQLVSFTGSVDSNSNLTLTSAPFDGGSVIAVDLPLTGAFSGAATGTIAVTGGSCTYSSSQALATESPSLTGTFSGSVNLISPTTGQPTSTTGTASLTLTQSATPNAQGELPVTGSLTFTSGSCSQQTAVSGGVSGSLLDIASAVNGTNQAQVSGSEYSDGSALIAILAFIPQLCPSLPSAPTFTGQLTRQ